MSNVLYIPKLNPCSFREIDPVEIPQYNSKQYGDYHYRNTLHEWEAAPEYCQKVQKTDVLFFQFLSNVDPLSLQVVNCDGRIMTTVVCQKKLQNTQQPGFYAYECSIAWHSIPNGCYYIQIITANTIELVSEPIQVAETFANTLLFSYFHTRYHEDIIFPTGIKFALRVEGSFGRLTANSKDQLYEDQKFNTTVLSSKPYTGFKLSIGGNRGVPDWLIEKMNYIWSCNNVVIDGTSYSKITEGFELIEEEDYPMRAIAMEVRYGVNRGSKIYAPELNINLGPMGVVYNIESERIFGQFPNGSTNVIAITSTE